MAEKRLIVKNFGGGIATAGQKRDVPDSLRFLKNLNPFEDTSYITHAMKSTKVSGTTVVALPHWAVAGDPFDTNKYFLDSGGNIYRETSGGTWSKLRTTASCDGEGLAVFDDYLYYMCQKDIGRYGPLTGTPSFDDNISSWWAYYSSDLQDTGGGTGEADYVPPTTIAETATARQTFTANNDPIATITIDVDVVGSGDWTVTLHDRANNSIATKTIANGSMSTGDVAFTFSNPARVVLGAEYHFHVTSTVDDGGVDTDVATDLEGAEYTITYNPLIHTPFHQAMVMEDQLIICNERYLAVFDQADYDPCKIVFSPGFKAHTMAMFDEYVVVGCYKGTNIYEADDYKLYFWDGISPSFDYSTSISFGASQALCNWKGDLFGVYGNRGAMYKGSQEFIDVVDAAPKLARGKRVEIYPGAITNYDSQVMIGIAGVTDDASGLEQGVYEYGRQRRAELEEALNYPYVISTGTTQGTSLKIGMVKSFGTDLYIGWRDDTSYGVDKVSLGDNAATSSSLETLIFDNGDPNHEKMAKKVIITFEALASGESITPKYKINRTSSFTTGSTESTTNATFAEVIVNKRFKEIEFGFNCASSNGTYPVITGVILVYDTLEKEREETR